MKRPIIITTSWDDGHKLDLKLATLMKKYRIKGTFYVSPKNREVDKKNRLSIKEIRKISEYFEIGAHTMTHQVLTRITHVHAEKEIKDSKDFLERLLQKKVEMFCYPKGIYNNKIKKIVESQGFIGARTIKQFTVVPSNDFFELNTTLHIFNPILRYYIPRVIINSPMQVTKISRNLRKTIERMTNEAERKGGVIHIWGHSWEIEKYELWKDLEEIFKYLSTKKNIVCMTNSETIKELKKENDKE